MRTVAIIILWAALGACAGEGSTTTVGPDAPVTTVEPVGATTTTLTSSTEPEPAPETTIGGQTAEITISGFSFGSQQTVAVGTTVIATNEDPFVHTWTSADGIWDSGNLDGGETFAHTFDEAGTYSFLCKIHPGEMGGSIVVEG